MLDKQLQAIPRRFTDINLAFIHLGGTKIMGIMLTMDGKQGAQLLSIIAPQIAFPVHFDDYTVLKSPLDDFKKAVNGAGLGNKVRYLHCGDTYVFDVPATEHV